MRGWLARLATTALAATGVIVAAPSTAYAETEPNNTMATANPIAVGLAGDPSATFNPADDEDYYRFEASRAGTYTIQAYDVSASLSAAEIDVYDSAGSWLADEDTGTNTVSTQTTVTLSIPGTYYIRARSYHDSEVGTYKLRVLPQFDQGLTWDSQGEPDGTRYLAPLIGIGTGSALNRTLQTINPALDMRYDADYVRFDAPRAGVYTVQAFDVATAAGRVPIDAYDSAGTWVSDEDTGTANVSTETLVEVPFAGTYFARIAPQYDTGNGTYKVRVLPQYDQGMTWGSDGEPNGNSFIAQPATLGRLLNGTLAVADPKVVSRHDTDFIRLATTAGGTYAVTVTSSATDLDVDVYDPAHNWLDDAFCYTGKPCDVTFTASLGGDYFVRVTPHSSTGSGTYTACLRLAGQTCSKTSGTVERWSGADRFATSATISRNTYNPGVTTAYVASGRVFPDALSGAPVAGMNAGPVLLVDTDKIPTDIVTELRRLQPGRIIVFGGPSTVSDGVMSSLRSYATSGKVDRWSGPDRYATSATISANSYPDPPSVAYVASGQVFPDALSAAPVAGMTRGPVLLVDTDKIPSSIASELTRLRPGKIVVLGGGATITENVLSGLRRYATSGVVNRWWGPDRFATSVAISKESFTAPLSTVYVASGRVFPDALSAAPAAGTKRAPVLLVDTDKLPPTVAEELARLRPKRIVILGGLATVSEGVEAALAAYTTG